MNFNRFWLFFMLVMILLLPISTASADSVYSSVIFPMTRQYPGASHQFPVNTQTADYYAGKWRPSTPQAINARYRPASDNRYQGYQFRPWNQNYRYRPNFMQRHSNYQTYQYRWRPIPYQVDYPRIAPGMPEYPIWQATYSPVGQGHARTSSWIDESGVMSPVAVHGSAYRPYRPGRSYFAHSSRHVYRSTNITIPNHYVFRPLRPRAQIYYPGKFIDSTQQRLAMEYHAAANNMPKRYGFRPLEVAQQTNDNQPASSIDILDAQLQTTSAVRAGVVKKPTFKPRYSAPVRYSHQPAPGYSFRQQHRRIPPARFRYLANNAAHPSVASYFPGRNHRPADPYIGYSHYPGNRYLQQAHIYPPGFLNLYDRIPDSVGSWYITTESRDWPMVSQFDQEEYIYPLMEFEGRGL